MLRPGCEMVPRPTRSPAMIIEVVQVPQAQKLQNQALTLDADLLHRPPMQRPCEAPPYLGAEDHQDVIQNPLPNLT